MSFATMIAEMRGSVPGYSALQARIHLRESWKDIRNLRGWSFQMVNGGFSTPGVVNAGTVTVQLGIPTVIGDAIATANWLTASSPISFLTNRQFRVGASTIYNIIAYDNGSNPTTSPNYPFATLTLDRPYIDQITGNTPISYPPFIATTQGYSIYQCYYPTPVKDFESWESVLDVVNVIWLTPQTNHRERERIDRNDPQRQIFSNPGTLLPYQVDTRVGSSTLGHMMYELYPQPQAQYSYSTWFLRLGEDLVNPSDTLPFPITETVVKAGARVKAYEWAEGNKNPNNPRGAGADFRFLMGAAKAEYDDEIKQIRLLDRERCDLWTSRMTRQRGFGALATSGPEDNSVMTRNTGY